jgi:valyl-tRNA synthetase
LVLLEQVMTLLHPLMPFITEEIYGYLPQVAAGDRPASLFDGSFPEVEKSWVDPAAEAAMEVFTTVVSGLRSAREELGLARDVVGKVTLVELEAGAALGLTGLAGPFRQLTGCELGEVLPGGEPPAGRYATVEGPGVKALLDLEGLVDVERERERLLSKAKKALVEQGKAKAKLGNQGFLAKAPEAVIAEERDKLATADAILEEVRRQYRERVGEDMPAIDGAKR